MRIIAIGGEPATGKSTLVRAILEELDPSHSFQFGRLRGHNIKDLNLWVLGIYNNDEEKFPGTDRLSMSVQPDAVRFLRELKEKAPTFKVSGWPEPTVLFEGDRLMNTSFLEQCFMASNSRLHVFFLKASQGTKDLRHANRRDMQSPTFIQGRATKTQNMINRWVCRVMENENLEDMAKLKNLIIAEIKRLN